MKKPLKRTYVIRVDRLDELLERNGMTLEDLAVESGVTARHLSRVRDGRGIRIRTLGLIASALRTTPDVLCDELPPTVQKPTRFKVRLGLSGTFQSAIQKDFLLRLNTFIVTQLKEEGIAVSGQSFTSVTPFSGSGAMRLAVGIRTVTDDKPSWLVAAIRPALLTAFCDSEPSSDAFSFGELIDCGWGEIIPRQAIARAARLLRCEPELIVNEALIAAE